MAEGISARVAWKLKKAIVGRPAKGTSNTGTASFVRTDENGVSWVRLPGANVDTPVNGNLVTDMQSGDTVSYRIDGGRLSVTGNATSPSVGGTYVDNTVAPVAEKADIAISDALRAHDAADLAENSAARAQASATSASEYASRALGNLSTVQSVAETLTWITAHGTMTPTTDTAPDPTHVYFVADSSGDYSVGGSTYSVVTEPDASDMATYYELSIDESLNNYVGTHLAVTDEGLWVIPVASGGYKVLIATGSGTTYTTAGTHIIDGSGVTVAFFGATTRIGNTDESHMELDYHSMQLIDKEGNAYFHVSDLRGIDGTAEITEYFMADGSKRNFSLSFTATDANYSVTIGGSEAQDITKSTSGFSFSTAPISGNKIAATYSTTSRNVKAFTLGTRRQSTGVTNNIGPYSMAMGISITSSGLASHAEGYNTAAKDTASHAEGTGTTADGKYSHAEGAYSIASGENSHSEGYGSNASGDSSHAEGKGTSASGLCAHAEGGPDGSYSGSTGPIASGMFSHAEGADTIAGGSKSHAEGYKTTASGYSSHSEGIGSVASGMYSHAQNWQTRASGEAQTVIGRYNDNSQSNAFEIGNGTSDSNRSNAFAVDWSGNVVAAGTVSAAKQTGTMTLNTTNCTQAADYNAAWHNGIVATVQLGTFTLASALANGSTVNVGTVPDGYRPAARIYANVAATNAAVSGMLSAYIATDGAITLVNRSGASVSTSVAITVTATYAI